MKTIARLIWSIAFLVLLVSFGYLYYRKATVIRRLCRQLQDYKTRTEELSAEKAALEREIDALMNDPDRLEKIAREKLGMAGEGEKIFIIDPTPPAGE